jgi:predicted nucleic acid-binding protein
VKAFFDTSVLVASFVGDHVHHQASLRAFAAATPQDCACSLHSLAEVFAVLSSLPVKPPIAPEQAALFVDEMRQRLTAVALNANEYHETVKAASERGIAGGRIYDALLLQCAEKSQAKVIYTWNLKHFQAIAPDLAERMRTP